MQIKITIKHSNEQRQVPIILVLCHVSRQSLQTSSEV